MLGLLAEKKYTGYLSYEAPNPDQWARSPYDVAREGVELTRKLLRDAVPSYVSA
jgi:2-keto-myo-inositol isomerase